MGLADTTLVRLGAQHQVIPILLDGVNETLLVRRPAGDRWSVADIVAHLGRYQGIFQDRIAIMIGGTGPEFERYRAELDPGFAEWRSAPLSRNIARLNHERVALHALLAGLDDRELAQRGSHPLFGAITIARWAEFFLLHEAHHLYAIMKLLGEFQRG